MKLDKIFKISPIPSLSKRGTARETELLFLLSRLDPDISSLENARAFIPNLNWDAFVPLTVKHGVSSLVYKNILRLENIPQDILARFEGLYNQCLRLNILMASELDRIIEVLSLEGIEVITLKGPVASEKIFGDIGLYPSGDIDILVKVDDIGRVKDLLESDGYRLNDKGFDEYRSYFLKELYHISLSNGQFTIEPHWNLFMRYFTASPEFWWEESIIISSGTKNYRFLSPEKNILYTSFRLFYKGFTPLRFLVLIAEIIRHYADETDWEKLFDYARQYRFENVLRVTMKLSHDLIGASIPQQYIYLKKPRIKLLYRLVSGMVLRAEDIHPVQKIILLFLRDDLTGIFRILLSRLFPSSGEIASRYRLSPGTRSAAAYYILNPVMLILGKHRK